MTYFELENINNKKEAILYNLNITIILLLLYERLMKLQFAPFIILHTKTALKLQ